MLGTPLVSVILPCYNAHKFIDSAIESIKNQTLKSWELIIVDDNSTDGSVEVIKGLLTNSMALIQSDVNLGYPSAMNIGIAAAKGVYIARMDADDVCLPSRLETQLNALEKYQHASFCGVNRFRITPGGKMYVDAKLPDGDCVFEQWEDLLTNRRIFTDPSVMVEKEKVISVGGYRTFQRSGMDVDLWLRLMERYGPCVTISAPLFGKRLEPGSIIFNPQTHLLNQVPRVLARQRKEKGMDVIQQGGKIDLEEMERMGIIKTNVDEKAGLFYGALVTCLQFGDWRGALLYTRHLQKTVPGFLSIFRIGAEVIKKWVQRMRHSPYARFSIPL